MLSERRLFPEVKPTEWVSLWRNGYLDEYGGLDDKEYQDAMYAIRTAVGFNEVMRSLRRVFIWKDRFANRWNDQLARITEADWNSIRVSPVMPSFWKNGIVYNVFLWHVTTDGDRPIIDQHAWRPFCYLSRLPGQIRNIPSNRRDAIRSYAEYEKWFRRQVSGGLAARELDQALMAFGQFCARCPKVIEHWIGSHS